MKKDFILKTQKNNILRISAFQPRENKLSSCLIYVHGFKGFKDWGFIPYLAEFFSNNGFFVITFNFSHNGVGESLTEFDELDKFEKNTISLEIEELNEVIGAYSEGFFNNNNQKIGILGHSRGGAISILTAAKNKLVNAVAVWASISRLDRYIEKEKELWRKSGFHEILNTRTKQKMKLGLSLLEDIEKNKEGSLSIEKAVKNLNKPFFIAHGYQDNSVPFSEAEDLYSWADKELTSFLEVPATDHTFDIVHPFQQSNPKFEMLLEKTNSFFKKYLN